MCQRINLGDIPVVLVQVQQISKVLQRLNGFGVNFVLQEKFCHAGASYQVDLRIFDGANCQLCCPSGAVGGYGSHRC